MSLIFATQLTAIATAALAVLALAAAIVAGIALYKQSRQLAILVTETNHQADERRRAQAARVFIGVPTAARNTFIPYVVNTSELPIFDAQLWYSDPRFPSDHDKLGAILPGERTGTGARAFNTYADAAAQTLLTFRDSAGVLWIRMPDGTLKEQTRDTAHGSVLAALGVPTPPPERS